MTRHMAIARYRSIRLSHISGLLNVSELSVFGALGSGIGTSLSFRKRAALHHSLSLPSKRVLLTRVASLLRELWCLVV
jgi:hypothetical protein